MKFFTIIIALILTTLVGFAQSHPCPTSIHRNNGNAPCAKGQLQLSYSTCPTALVSIDSVYVNGIKDTTTFGAPDTTTCKAKGYVGYCIITGNTPPAGNWDIYCSENSGTVKYICKYDASGILPISIKTFNATRNKGYVQLNWETSLEINGEAFVIERKTGNDFVTVATVAANNNASGSTYSFTDNNNMKSVSEYRLKLVSKDADAKYSETRIVKGTGNVDFTIYPNPATRNAKISISDVTNSTTVQVLDNTGRIVKTLSFKNSNTIEVNDLERGIYRIQLMDTNSGIKVTKTLTIL